MKSSRLIIDPYLSDKNGTDMTSAGSFLSSHFSLCYCDMLQSWFVMTKMRLSRSHSQHQHGETEAKPVEIELVYTVDSQLDSTLGRCARLT